MCFGKYELFIGFIGAILKRNLIQGSLDGLINRRDFIGL
jgi:hypothetical protein